MDLLRSILQHKPAEWTDEDYNNRRYIRVALEESSSEYKQIAAEFSRQYQNQPINKIERVQHPFALARYKIRKEQLAKIHGYEPSEERHLIPTFDPNNIENVFEFNCDQRRGFRSSIFSSRLLRGRTDDRGYIIVIKVLGSNMDQRDTHRYPEYIIEYGMSSSGSNLDSLNIKLRGLTLHL